MRVNGLKARAGSVWLIAFWIWLLRLGPASSSVTRESAHRSAASQFQVSNNWPRRPATPRYMLSSTVAVRCMRSVSRLLVMRTAEGVPVRRGVPSAFGAPVVDQNRVPNGLKGLVAGTMMSPSVEAVMPSGSR